jgi:hypothetical protein
MFSRSRRALICPRPVRYFTRLNDRRCPYSTSLDETNRQPWRSARSVFTASFASASFGRIIRLLLRDKIATLDELKQAPGTPVDVTTFRKLKPLDYLTSYSHRGRYYTLREIARFDDNGLWSQAEAWFSRFGTLLATAEEFVNGSPADTSPMSWLPPCTSRCRIRCIN